MARLSATLLVAGWASTALGAGCSLFSPERTGLLETRFPEARISSSQLRGWISDAVLDSADRIQESADEIRARSRDPGIRRNALLWKINAIQACFRAATRRDPMGAFADLWILFQQMVDYFDAGAGRDLFGPYQPLALGTARTLETRLESTFKAMFPPEVAEEKLIYAREHTAEFARDYPLESLSFQREPLTGHPSTVVPGEIQGLGGVVSNLEQDLLTTQRMLLAYTEYLPWIARWQAELLLEDVGQTAVVADALSLLKETQALLRDGMTKQLPGEITRVLAAIDGERKGAMADLDGMRVATLDSLQQERKAITEEVDRQRLATLQQLHDEWKGAFEDVRAAGRDGADSALRAGGRWVDQLARKAAAAALCLLLVLALGVGALLACLRVRTQGAAGSPKVPPDPR
jgi:hypothetical protein